MKSNYILLLLLSVTWLHSYQTKDEIITAVKQHNVSYLRCLFSDLLNNLKEVIVPQSQIKNALYDGLYFDGSSIPGFTHIYDSDMHLALDTTTFRLITDDHEAYGVIICDVEYIPGHPYDGSARQALKEAIKKAADMGYGLHVGPEIEFFLFKENAPCDNKRYFDTTELMPYDSKPQHILAILNHYGVNAEKIHHEVAPGQYEFSIKYGDPLSIADQITLAKTALRGWASNHNLEALFMPKPLAGQNGSGMHIHFSLYDIKTGKNLFYDSQDINLLSETAHHFIAGVLQHLRELSIFFNSTVNSFKRLVPCYEAPIYICWAPKNRSALVRIPDFIHPHAARAELRCPDALCNPYLAFAALLHAGLDGIETKASLGQAIKTNLYKLNKEQINNYGITVLPTSLHEALTYFRTSTFAQHVFSQRLFNELETIKRKEVEEYNKIITSWEWERYKNC